MDKDGLEENFFKNPLTDKEFNRFLADQTVANCCNWASFAGFIPLPAIDIAIITGIQTLMIKKLCKLYGVAFKKEMVTAVVAGLASSGIGTVLSGKLATNLLNPIPFVGTILGATTLSVVSYASTYAIGKVFIKHFESQGTVEDFMVENYKSFFETKFALAKDKFTRNTKPSSA
jgi:uncharacterized protein (DUF697 family)